MLYAIRTLATFRRLSKQGAKGPGSEKSYTVIPVGKVPPELTGNVDHDLVFFAEMGEYLPLEDQYKEEAKSYFDPKDLTIDTGKFISLEIRKNFSKSCQSGAP